MHCQVGVGQNAVDINGKPLTFDLTPSQCAALKPGPFLGQGAYATAYEVEGDPTKVVKFTVDPLDAKAARRLQRHKPKGAVRIDTVATLLGQKTNAAVPIQVYDPTKDEFTDRPGKQPVFAIVAERLRPLENHQKQMIEALKVPFHIKRGWLATQDSGSFKVPDDIRDKAMLTCTKKLWYDAPECRMVIDEAIEAVEEVAHKTGTIPLDIHAGNWGMKPNGDLALLDLGVSAGAEEDTVAESLAGLDDIDPLLLGLAAFGLLWFVVRR